MENENAVLVNPDTLPTGIDEMEKINIDQFIWVEKYRPQKLKDLIIPDVNRKQIQTFINDGKLPHLLLTSTNPGVGKTSIAKTIVSEINADVKWINGSQDRGIDTFKIAVKEFITSVSIDDTPKIVVIDEADGLTRDAQKVLRGLIEEYSMDSTFIMTANYKDNLIEPLRNRFIHLDFDEIYNSNKRELGLQILNRLKYVLYNENISYDNKDIPMIVSNYYPSVRKMILTLQQFSDGTKLNVDKKSMNIKSRLEEILNLLKGKKFIDIRRAIQELDDASTLYSYIFKNLDLWFEPESQPQVILLCAKYQDMSERARDKAITSSAFCVEIMGTPGIKFV